MYAAGASLGTLNVSVNVPVEEVVTLVGVVTTVLPLKVTVTLELKAK